MRPIEIKDMVNSAHVNVCLVPRDCCGAACLRQTLGFARCQDASAIGAGYPSFESKEAVKMLHQPPESKHEH